ncbi:MAG: metalloregulator ArsR/SmtB family transcription factor [Candidatus Dojkabacteria bacterium]|jgi:ArsR family transcriptional regulator|nr:metalloregulator ArsR/SmtB family transcription factor [Candidatus Dojkabacteria bacterium]
MRSKNAKINKSELLQSLLEPNRIRILEFLHKNDSCVCELVRELKIKHSLLSHHLSTLMNLKILENEKKGRHIIYRVRDNRANCVNTVLKLINEKIDCN